MEAPSLFVYKVEEAVAVITSHLLRSSEPAASLPPGLFLDIAQFLTLEERGKAVCCVSRKWRQLGEHNHLWREPYLTRFKFHSPQEDLATHTEAQELAQPGPKVKDLFARRLVRPQVGDRVEVAWRGKFRLESLEIYNGLAWWLAEIVECDADGQRYKVHYPGWEARWDEFVPRERLRWGNDRRAAQLRDERIAVGDMVEIWCGGTNVPGAWLEGRVSSIRGERVFLGDVVAEGFFSVTEERCRLVSKGASAPPQSEGRSDTARALCNIARQSCGCSVM
ncbi:hypothetical protein JKP88DRAFT_178183 [Tribonema minus]|uniref:F-box domain-containing protein n=1 Tax=Tribonema minus TaxID=303371 RepID=A0A835ZFT0_9STRA|nr:hypothetical protein JKP88DRAFT_178183 [Tribonema minus]